MINNIFCEDYYRYDQDRINKSFNKMIRAMNKYNDMHEKKDSDLEDLLKSLRLSLTRNDINHV